MQLTNVAAALVLSETVLLATACFGADHGVHQAISNPVKEQRGNQTVPWKKIAIRNAKVFDGTRILPPATVVIDGARIGSPHTVNIDTEIDAKGGILLPGFIDAHAHPTNGTHLQDLVSYGVTSVLSMACFPEEQCNLLRNQLGLSDFFTAGLYAASPNGTHGMVPNFPKDQLIHSPADANAFVGNRVGNGTDYIKLIAEANGLTLSEHLAIVTSAHEFGMSAMTHTNSLASYNLAIRSGTDIIQHLPPDGLLTPNMTSAMLHGHPHHPHHRISACGTLTVIKSIIDSHSPEAKGWNYTLAEQNLLHLFRAGIPLLAGTDASSSSGQINVPSVPFGSSLHGEMELMSLAGIPNLEILRSATANTAAHFGLVDRGAIKPGFRADLVLVKGDPLVDIRNTKGIQRVWAAGLEVEHAAGAAAVAS